MIRTVASLAVIATAMLGLAACSGGDDGSSDTGGATTTAATPPNDDTAALEQTVRDYVTAFFAADEDTGYALLSARCKDQIPKGDYSALLDQAQEIYGRVETEPTIHVDELSGNLARVTYGVGIPALDKTRQLYAKEDEAWRWDGC